MGAGPIYIEAAVLQSPDIDGKAIDQATRRGGNFATWWNGKDPNTRLIEDKLRRASLHPPN